MGTLVFVVGFGYGGFLGSGMAHNARFCFSRSLLPLLFGGIFGFGKFVPTLFARMRLYRRFACAFLAAFCIGKASCTGLF